MEVEMAGAINEVVIGEGSSSMGSMDMGMDMGMDTGMDMGMTGEETGTVDVMTSIPFVAGISVLSLVIAVGIGIVLAKIRIKKGLNIYED